MMLAVGSAFRNCAPSVPRYFAQVSALRHRLRCDVRVIAAEGDSADGGATRDAIAREATKAALKVQFVACDHGGPEFGSTERQDRLDALTRVGNAILDGVAADDDALLYVESDLIWEATAIAEMVRGAVLRSIGGGDVVAPMIWSQPGIFYDIFCYRKDGQRFSPFAPYHPALGRGPTEVDSVGSCLAMRAAVARAVRMPPGEVLIGWCRAAREQGFRIVVDPRISVRHP